MMGRRSADQQSLFHMFNLDEVVAKNHLLRRIDPFVTEALGDLHAELDIVNSGEIAQRDPTMAWPRWSSS